MILGQLLMLLSSIWMLKAWRIKDDAPGWYAAAFCSALLIGSFSGSVLLAQVIDLTPMYWFKQLALYAAFPFLSFVLVSHIFAINWQREAWGRILLGVCGIYWVCQQTQNLDYLLMISAVVSTIAMMKLLLGQGSAVCSKQASLALSVATFASLIVVLNAASSLQNNNNPVLQELSAQWPQEFGLGLMLIAINRTLYLKFKSL